MIIEEQFEVTVSKEDALRFADISGDWNPLHTDPVYAATSVYGCQVLHGAFSAGLISRLAGMYLPGKDCLLYGIKLRFVNPILPPATLVVRGKVVMSSSDLSRVKATVSDAATGKLYVDGSYEFNNHRLADDTPVVSEVKSDLTSDKVVLVTGASGGLGKAVIRLLGDRGRAVKRNDISGRLESSDIQADIDFKKNNIAAIIHCAWPNPDNGRFIDIENPEFAIEQQLTGPIRDIQVLSSLLASNGIKNAPLILIGSTFAERGRHYFRMPLYSIAKATIPTIVDVLALELASKTKRCYGVVFDVLDGGMNKGISDATRLSNADRSPWGELATTEEAANQVIWLLNNQSKLINGAVLKLSGGSIP
jgi:NAD(P)-dependent dehydrogenase (short-subunit alcohol dehydrogenase family)